MGKAVIDLAKNRVTWNAMNILQTAMSPKRYSTPRRVVAFLGEPATVAITQQSMDSLAGDMVEELVRGQAWTARQLDFEIVNGWFGMNQPR